MITSVLGDMQLHFYNNEPQNKNFIITLDKNIQQDIGKTAAIRSSKETEALNKQEYLTRQTLNK